MCCSHLCVYDTEFVIKCPFPARMQHIFFRTHLKWFSNAFQKPEICLKALTKGKTLNSWINISSLLLQ